MAMTPTLITLLMIICITFPSNINSSPIPPQPPQPNLTLDYYAKTCPTFQKIVRSIAAEKQAEKPVTAAGTLRLFFHDCMVTGCDASVLVTSNHVNIAERDADPNLSLSGDAFDVVQMAKTELELTCPGVVSCSDILAEATRDLVTMVGGPYYQIRLGRLDGFVSRADLVEANIPKTNQTMNQLIKFFKNFKNRGFTTQEMVALTGAHTIGFSHCKEVTNRLFNFNMTHPTDPTMHPKLAEGLKRTCGNFKVDKSMSAFNDPLTPGKFDNMYYMNLKRRLGLLTSDMALVKDKRTRPLVEMYATDQKAFFDAFGRAMEKLSLYGVKTGKDGEVRRRCDTFNDAIMS